MSTITDDALVTAAVDEAGLDVTNLDHSPAGDWFLTLDSGDSIAVGRLVDTPDVWQATGYYLGAAGDERDVYLGDDRDVHALLRVVAEWA